MTVMICIASSDAVPSVLSDSWVSILSQLTKKYPWFCDGFLLNLNYKFHSMSVSKGLITTFLQIPFKSIHNNLFVEQDSWNNS